MDSYFSGIAISILATILVILLKGKNGEIALAVTLCGCCMVVILLAHFLEPVVSFLYTLDDMMNSNGIVRILIKIVGIGFVGEIAALVCTDGGNGAMGKTVQMLTAGTILYLSLPILTQLLELVEGMLTVR